MFATPGTRRFGPVFEEAFFWGRTVPNLGIRKARRAVRQETFGRLSLLFVRRRFVVSVSALGEQGARQQS
jgi:hypothetical protein